jgi:hypothetical protein
MERSLLEIQRQPIDKVLATLKSGNSAESVNAGTALVKEAASFGLDIRDYLTLAINPDAPVKMGDREGHLFKGLNGYEAALAYLNLPFKNDFEKGIVLAAAAETFQKFPGTRAMFPEVIDDMLRWQNRQNTWETVAPILANSRTISGTELISTVVLDDSEQRKSYTIPEGANIPVRSIRTSQTSVSIYKHGSGYRTTYEFSRRASLDILTPFAARVQRELDLSKLTAAVNILISGDGVNAAAAEVNQFSLTGYDAASAGKLQYRPLLKWLVDRAKAGTPVDTVVGDYDAYLQWIFMFSPVLNVKSEVAAMAEAGLAPKMDIAVPVLNTNVRFVPASAAPAGKLVGLLKGETLEELVEAGSLISESDSAIRNQTITYVRTHSTGYKLAFGDTRSIYDYAQTS